MPPANTYGKTGIADLHAVKPGTFMVVEFKIGSNKPTELQKAFLTMIAKAGHLAFVVNDTNLPHFASFLENFDKARSIIEEGGEEKDLQPVWDMLSDDALELTKDFSPFETLAKMAAAMPTAH
jgi:hypothetical protein